MASAPVARPNTRDLTFQVFDRSVHPELFESLLVRSFERDGYRLRVHLTRAGHVLEWCWGKITLVEILTDQSGPLPEQRQLFAHRVGGERTESYGPCDSVSYQTCFQLERLPPRVFYHLHDELRTDGQRDGLLHVLEPQDRLGHSPLSFLDLQARPRSVIVHAYHTYPDEFAVVKSQSLVEIAR